MIQYDIRQCIKQNFEHIERTEKNKNTHISMAIVKELLTTIQ